MSSADTPSVLPSRRAIGVGAGVAVALSAAVVWSTTTLALATTLPESVVATGLSPIKAREEQSKRKLADAQTRAQVKEARVLARDVYRASPLATGALAVFAIADRRLGEAKRSEALLVRAAAISRRDDLVNLLELTKSAASGNVDEMVLDVDIALRTNRKVSGELWPALFIETADPRFAEALARRLALRPLWRLRFLEALGSDPQHAQAALNVLNALQRLRSGPSSAEVAYFFTVGGRQLDPLIQRQNWIRLDPATNDKAAGRIVYDGDFAGLGGSVPFNWVLGSAEGVDVAPEIGDDGGRYLAVRFTGTEPATLARQIVTAPPGRHRLSFRTAGLDGLEKNRFDWSIVCVNGPVLAKGSVLAGELPSRIVAGFTVPKGCSGQWLNFDVAPKFGELGRSFMLDDIVIG